MSSNHYKVLSYVLITGHLGGFNLLYGLFPMPYILQEVIYFVPFFITLIWLGYFLWNDMSTTCYKSERIILRGLIITTCLLFLTNILLNLFGLKYLDMDMPKDYNYTEFRNHIDSSLWNFISLGALLLALITIGFKSIWTK